MNNRFFSLVFVLITLTSACASTQNRVLQPEFTLPSFTLAAFAEGSDVQAGIGGCTRNGRGLCVTYAANKIDNHDLRDLQQMYLICAYDPADGSKIVTGSANGCIRAFDKMSPIFIDNVPLRGQVTITLEQVVSLQEPPVMLARRTCTKVPGPYENFINCN